MEDSHLLRHQLINDLMAGQPLNPVPDAAIRLWQQLAIHSFSIIGEDGFRALYARSIFLNQSKFPWLAVGQPSSQIDHQFAELKAGFEEQTAEQVSETNRFLVLTFTDILAPLIGEKLTTCILRLSAILKRISQRKMMTAPNLTSK